MNGGHCGASMSELHNGLEMLLSLSKVKIDVANIIDKKQRVATVVFSQFHHVLFCFNYHLQYFVLCV